jgi:hypothetical protein
VKFDNTSEEWFLKDATSNGPAVGVRKSAVDSLNLVGFHIASTAFMSCRRMPTTGSRSQWRRNIQRLRRLRKLHQRLWKPPIHVATLLADPCKVRQASQWEPAARAGNSRQSSLCTSAGQCFLGSSSAWGHPAPHLVAVPPVVTPKGDQPVSASRNDTQPLARYGRLCRDRRDHRPGERVQI